MMGSERKNRSDLLRTIRAPLSLLLFCLVLAWPPQASSQQTTEKSQKTGINDQSKRTTKEPQKGTVDPRKSVPKLSGIIVTPPNSGDNTPPMMGEPPIEEPIWTELSLDWTNCQIHRVYTDSAIVIILPGTISSSNSIYWNLNTISPQPGGLPVLYFVEDVLGRSGPEYGIDIPLIWEISVDGGRFNPIRIQPDSALFVNFPSGHHTFQVRITGVPQHNQGDGYYQLLLGQSLVPEL